MMEGLSLEEFKQLLHKNPDQLWVVDDGIPSEPRFGYTCFSIPYVSEHDPDPNGNMYVVFYRGGFWARYEEVTFRPATHLDRMVDYTMGAVHT